MNKNEGTFQEQDHPLKNTDDAFVQVGKNGQPVVPSVAGEEDKKGSDKEKPATYDRP